MTDSKLHITGLQEVQDPFKIMLVAELLKLRAKGESFAVAKKLLRSKLDEASKMAQRIVCS